MTFGSPSSIFLKFPSNDSEDLVKRIISKIDGESADNTSNATFAMGCFWRPDSLFGGIDGIMRTRVGYAGGSTSSPTYESIGDHIESVQVKYDTDSITYGDLLEFFWKNHDPRAKPFSRQYSSAIFTHDTKQEKMARDSLEDIERRMKVCVSTDIIPLDIFHIAEGYHQKHGLRRNEGLFSIFWEIYGSDDRIRDSTAAARFNSIGGGFCPPGI